MQPVKIREIIEYLIKDLETSIESLPCKDPKSIFNGAKYSFTSKENPFTKRSHSLMISLITKCLWDALGKSSESKYIVEIEPRFSYTYFEEGNEKFSPDIVVYEANKNENIESLKPILFIDYESPNSSDARVNYKDIDQFMYFSEYLEAKDIRNFGYLILTSHRDYESEVDDLLRVWRYGYNSEIRNKKGFKNSTKNDAWKFWKEEYKKHLKTWNGDWETYQDRVHLYNISNGTISAI